MYARMLVVASLGLISLTAVATAQTPPAPAAAPAAQGPAVTAAPAPAAPAAAAPAASNPAPLTRIRGTIASYASHVLTINARDGSQQQVTLADPLTVVTVKRVPLSAIKQGDYLGIASRSGPHNTTVALEVLVFPEAMRGAGAGHYDWDLRPGSMMTNAPVTGVATARSGRNLTLTYQGGSVTIHVPARAPVVTFAPASPADLKAGRRVFLAARKDADGHLSTSRATVGTHGVNPPM